MRVTTPRNATPAIAVGLAGALVAAYLATSVGSFPSPLPAGGAARGGGDTPPAADAGDPARTSGSVESLALDTREGTGLASTPLIDEAGRLWVGHHDDAPGEVLVALCPSVRCETAERITLADGHAAYGLDLTLAPGGVAASYVELDTSKIVEGVPRRHFVALVTCASDCTQTLRRVLAGPLPRPTGTAIAVDDVGRPLVAYQGVERDLVLTRCLDVSCSVWTSTTLAPVVGDDVALALTSTGAPIVASRDAESDRLQVTLCHDGSCETHRTVVLGDEGGGVQPSMVLTAADEVVLSHRTGDGLELVWCGLDCRAPARRLVARGTAAGTFSTVALDGDLPVVSFYDDVERAPILLRCEDAACRASTTAVVDDRRLGGEQLGMVLTEGGTPVLTYQDGAGHFLRLTRCASPACGTARPLSTTSAIEVVDTAEGPIAVYLDADRNVRTVACGDSSCADAPTRVLDAGGAPPVEAVATVGGGLDGLALATRAPGSTTATLRLCASDCADTSSVSVEDVARLLALHATRSGVEVLHVDTAGSIATVHCDAAGCGGTRLLGIPGEHATIAVADGEHTAIAWHEPGTGDVWAVRCDDGCGGAPRAIGTWPQAGDLHVAATADEVAVAVERVDTGGTEVARCNGDCLVVNTVPGRPLGLIADEATVTLLVVHEHETLVHVCNGRCTTTNTGLDAGLMTPTLVSSEPLRLLGRDRTTMSVVTRHCDRDRCTTEGLGSSDGTGSSLGVK